MPSFAGQDLGRVLFLQRLRFDPIDLDAQPVGQAAVDEGLVQAHVGIVEPGVLADESDLDDVLGVLDPVDHGLPRGQVLCPARQAEHLEDRRVESLVGVVQRDLVDRFDVARRDDGVDRDVGEQRDLGFDVGGEVAPGAAEQDVRLDADRPELLDAVLRRLGLELAGDADVGDEGQVDEEGPVDAQGEPHLPRRLEERQALDVADGPSYLADNNIVTAGHALDGRLDHVGDVGDDLDGLAEIFALALLADDGLVDLAGRPVVGPRRLRRGEALVVAEVEVRLRAVVGDVDLAVLERAHRARDRR